MIFINNVELPEDTNSVRLEPCEELDKAVIGYDQDEDKLIYSVDTLLSCFEAMGMTLQDAWEWFLYNTLRTGDYVENYPIFIDEDGEEI